MTYSLVPAKPATTGPQADPQTAIRRDYELALQAGERDAWEAFLRAYPDGFYADLAKVQLRKKRAAIFLMTAITPGLNSLPASAQSAGLREAPGHDGYIFAYKAPVYTGRPVTAVGV